MFIFKSTSMGIINHMNRVQNRLNTLSLRLSTGQRINCAADDPAGLAISERMRAQIRGLSQAQRNVQDGISLIQTAEGGINEIHDILQRMRELAVQASNGTYTDQDRQKLNDEFTQLKKAIGQTVDYSEYNTIPLLDGSKESEGIKIQAGPNVGQTVEINIGNCSLDSLGLFDVEIVSQEAAQQAIAKVEHAIDKASSHRSNLGAMQNRLEHTLNYLENAEYNLTAAESRIRDADMAQTIMEYTKNQILLQVAQAMMAQTMRMERERIMMLLKSLE